MDKLEALRYFCTAAETLNFRDAALKLAISPPVVSRVISELEQQLGEALFRRNTRNIRLTHFGERLLPKAQQLLADSELLFNTMGREQENEMSGVVRIALPRFPEQSQVLRALLQALADYPELVIDWQIDTQKLDDVAHRIDMGIRVGTMPREHFITKAIVDSQAIFVAAPSLIQRLGEPADWQDLRKNYPLTGLYNPHTGKIWDLEITHEQRISHRNLAFISNDVEAELQAALAGQAVSCLSTTICRDALARGELQIVLPNLILPTWQVYLYRPYQVSPPKRVLVVFDLLYQILREHFQPS